MAFRRVRLAQRRKALGHSQDDLATLVGVDRSTVIRWERAETEPQPWLRRKLATTLRVTPEELTELLEAVSEVPTRRDGYTLLSSVPLDFSLLPGHTVRVMEGFSAHDLASRRQVLERLSILTSAALLKPIRQWVACFPLRPISAGVIGPDELNASHAVRLADAVRSSVVYDWLLRFHADLTTLHPSEPPVDTFTDQLRDYLRRAAPSREAEVGVAGKH